ncbi:hypothetical protein [endosymbiont GvMRE of Glomus versiforme]|uniref:hypothetical protein n=1 Tax=endosymbiont GvMRE of Glomus versiforme TaxID=2039283 RepID=UPI0011C425FC|nr:hypothetical protein [endosymbiont GvMRE of Glomus versiforme]
MIGGIVWKYTQSDNNGQLSEEEELEKYLLEKRLELKKYFVFNLGELKRETLDIKRSDGKKITWIRGFNKLLAQHFTNLTGKTKDFIWFCAVSDTEWEEEKLNQKITDGKIYIVFDKKIAKNENIISDYVTNWGKDHFSNGITFNVISQWVNIFYSKEETVKFLKSNDPLLIKKQ